MSARWERREQKKKGAWYKRHLASNRKSLNIIIKARMDRLEKEVNKNI